MRKKHLILFLLFLSSFTYAQDMQPITVYKKTLKFRKSIDMTFGFAKGDIVILNYKEIDDKNMRNISIYTYDKTKIIYESVNKPTNGVVQYEMQNNDVLYFYFEAPELLNRELSIEIQRIPASKETVAFNTGITEKTITNDIEMKYEKKTQKKVEKKVVEHKTKMFEKYVIQDVPIYDKSFQLKSIITGSSSNEEITIKLPKPPTSDSKLYYVSYYFNSVIGGSKHWKIVKTAVPLTVSVVSSFLLTPAGGAAAGASTAVMLDAMGPHPGGEPTTMMLVSPEDFRALNAAKGDKNKAFKVLNEGKGTSFAAMMTNIYAIQRFDQSYKKIYLQNLDVLKAKNIKANVSASYYAPIYVPVTVKEKIFTPIFESKTVSENFKISTTKTVPVGITANSQGEKYVKVEYPDTIWSVETVYSSHTDKVSLTPRLSRMKSQVTKKSEIVYSQAFAAPASDDFAVKIRLPKPVNDYYQTKKYTKLKFTLTVGDATYQAFKGQVSNIIESGISYGIGKGTGKIAGKMGKTKAPGDESMNTVESILDAKEKYDMANEVIESSKDVKDIYETGDKKKEDKEEEEAFFMKNGSPASTVLKKAGVDGDDIKEVIPESLLKLDIPSISDISDKAADVVTPKIKDKIILTVFPAGQANNILIKKETGFLVDSIDIKGNADFNFIIDNPRSSYDPKNFLSMYIFGTLMVEAEYEQVNYKDMITFDEVREPTAKSKEPKQTYKVVTRTKYIPKSEMKPWYKVIN